METLLDQISLSIEEATGHLWAVEHRRKKCSTFPVTDVGGRLLLTEEEWTAWMKAKEKAGTSGRGGSNGGDGRGHDHDKNKGRDSGKIGGATNSNPSDGGGVTLATIVAKWATDCVSVGPRRRQRTTRPKMRSHRYY
jgi:hypothetical protein